MFDLLDISDLSTALGVSVNASRLSHVVVSGTDLLVNSDDSVVTQLSSNGLAVGDESTFEAEVVFNDLPIAVSPLFERISVGLLDAQGKGIFLQISADELGVADRTENSGALVTRSTLQSISYTIRILADQDSGIADVYFTKTSDIATLGHQFALTTALLTPDSSLSDGFYFNVLGRVVHPITITVKTLRLASTLVYPNRIPVAVISDTTGRVSQATLLDASGSYDPEGAYLTYLWSVVSVPTGSTITAGSLKPSERFHLPGSQDSKPYFIPDKPGIYVFSLTVNDGSLSSVATTVSVQVSSASLERGYIPDATPLFSILSSSWEAVEHKEVISTFWSSVMQLVSADLTALWQKDRDKSVNTIQREIHRKWMDYDPRVDLSKEIVQVNSITGASGTTGVISYVTGSDMVAYGTLIVTSASALFVTRGIRPGDRITIEGESLPLVVSSVIDENTLELRSVVAAGTGLDYAAGSQSTLYESGATISSPAGSLVRIEDLSSSWVRQVTFTEAEYLQLDEVVPTTETGLNWEITSGEIVFPFDVPEKMALFYVDLLTWDDTEEQVTEVLGTRANRIAFFPTAEYLAMTAPSLKTGTRLHRIPCPVEVSSIPFLQTIINDPPDDDLLLEYQDFTIEDSERGEVRWIVFNTPYTQNTVPDDCFWAEYTYLGNLQSIEDNFGERTGIKKDDFSIQSLGVDYLSAVRAILFTQFMGPSIGNLETGLCVFCGIPFLDAESTIQKIEDTYTTTQGRITVQETASGLTKTYLYLRTLGLSTHPTEDREIMEGDTLPAYTPLSTGAEVVDWVSHSLWWKSMGLQEVEKFFTFGVWIDVDVRPTADLSILLGACIDYINRVKPTYTKVVGALQKRLDDTISVTDAIALELTLTLYTKADRDSRIGLFNEKNSDGTPAWRFDGDLPANYADRAGVESSAMVIMSDETGGGGALKFNSAFRFNEPGLQFNGTIPVGTKTTTVYDEDTADAGAGPT